MQPKTILQVNILSGGKNMMVFHCPRAVLPCLILAFLRTNRWCQAPRREHAWQYSDHLSQHTQWCLCLRALAQHLCWTQLEWFKVLLISSCLHYPSPGGEGTCPSCSAAAAVRPTHYLKPTLAGVWCQDVRLRTWKWVKSLLLLCCARRGTGRWKAVLENISNCPACLLQNTAGAWKGLVWL